MALSEVCVTTRAGIGSPWFRRPAAEVEPLQFSVRCPALFEHLHLLGRSNAESRQRQDHGTNSHNGLGSFANLTASWALDDRRADVAFGSDAMKHRIKFIAQLYQFIERKIGTPPGAQSIKHLWKPCPARVPLGHSCTILIPPCRRPRARTCSEYSDRLLHHRAGRRNNSAHGIIPNRFSKNRNAQLSKLKTASGLDPLAGCRQVMSRKLTSSSSGEYSVKTEISVARSLKKFSR